MQTMKQNHAWFPAHTLCLPIPVAMIPQLGDEIRPWSRRVARPRHGPPTPQTDLIEPRQDSAPLHICLYMSCNPSYSFLSLYIPLYSSISSFGHRWITFCTSNDSATFKIPLYLPYIPSYSFLSLYIRLYSSIYNFEHRWVTFCTSNDPVPLHIPSYTPYIPPYSYLFSRFLCTRLYPVSGIDE